MLLAVKIYAGFLLDLLLGDPHGFQHPVRFIGKYIVFLEKKLRKLKNEKIGGVILASTVILTAYFLTYYISSVAIIIEIIIIYSIFAVKSLASEAEAVYDLLDDNNIDGARKQIGFLVSRDTGDMTEKDIIRAMVETVSENIVDGIIAPIFFLFIGGAAAGMAYKAASTLDSMVGYKNDIPDSTGFAESRFKYYKNLFILRSLTKFFAIPGLRLGYGIVFDDKLA